MIVRMHDDPSDIILAEILPFDDETFSIIVYRNKYVNLDGCCTFSYINARLFADGVTLASYIAEGNNVKIREFSKMQHDVYFQSSKT